MNNKICVCILTLVLVLGIVFSTPNVYASRYNIRTTDTPYFELPTVHTTTQIGYEEYFKEFFETNNFDVRGQAYEYKYAAYAAMSIEYMEEHLGRKLTYDELLAGAWFSEAGIVWLYDSSHPIVDGTKEALAHQINSYCGGVGVLSCQQEYILLALGLGWQAFRYNMDTHGNLPQGDNIVAFLTTDLSIYERGRAVGLTIVNLSTITYTCDSAWSVGIVDPAYNFEIGDQTTTGYIAWVGELPESINPFTGYEHAIINSCGIRLK